MEHNEVQENLDEYVNGSINPEMHERITQHLNECAICKGEYEDIRIISTAIDQLSQQPAPAGFESAVYKIINAKRHSKYSLENLLNILRPPHVVWVGGLASILIILLVVNRQSRDKYERAIFSRSLNTPLDTVETVVPQEDAGRHMKDSVEKVVSAFDKDSTNSQKFSNIRNSEPRGKTQISHKHSELGSHKELSGIKSDSSGVLMSSINEKDLQRNKDILNPKRKRNKGQYTSADGQYVFKTKAIPSWITNPNAVYIVNDSGLNVCSLIPPRAVNNEKTNLENVPYLSEFNILSLDFSMSMESKERDQYLLNKLFARFKFRRLDSVGDKDTFTMMGVVHQQSFPQFISELQFFGTTTSGPFKKSHGDSVKIKISVNI